MTIHNEDHRYHYWIVAKDEKGTPILIYGAQREDEARMRGLEMLPGIDFALKRLPTRDLGRASSLLKGNRLESTHNLKEATKRLKHTLHPKKKQSSKRRLPAWLQP